MLQHQHAALPVADHDEFAREEFCACLRKLFTTELWPANRALYEQRMRPEFVARTGREPATLAECKQLMEESAAYRATNAIGRATQELLWDSVGESVERQLDTLVARARPRADDLGTLRLNPDLAIPRYIDSVDIHVMPGNFHTELGRDDVFAGALYDRGVHVFAFGGLGGLNDGMGQAAAAFFQERFPELKPRRILDMGCGPGFTTLPWKEAFPQAEVHGIDIGAPQVRHAHSRAEALGRAIHYSQQDASATDFPDGHFDIVVSLLLTHEMPVPVIRKTYHEAHRLLAPGGVMLHDAASSAPLAAFEQLMQTWFAYNVNEPFSMGWRGLDHRRAIVEAGFDPAQCFTGQREAVYLKGQLPPVCFLGAVKS